MQHNYWRYDQDWEERSDEWQVGDDVETPTDEGIIIEIVDDRASVWLWSTLETEWFNLNDLRPTREDEQYYPVEVNPSDPDSLPF